MKPFSVKRTGFIAMLICVFLYWFVVKRLLMLPQCLFNLRLYG